MNKTDWTVQVPIYKEPFSHVRWDDIEKLAPKEELESFDRWMMGQTVGMLPDGTDGIYPGDFHRWVRQGRKQEQGADWD